MKGATEATTAAGATEWWATEATTGWWAVKGRLEWATEWWPMEAVKGETEETKGEAAEATEGAAAWWVAQSAYIYMPMVPMITGNKGSKGYELIVPRSFLRIINFSWYHGVYFLF